MKCVYNIEFLTWLLIYISYEETLVMVIISIICICLLKFFS